ncbi:hypothetical protein JZ751_023996, partial [Albula glossodonta]
MVDDIQIEYYDSNIKRVVSRRPQNTTAEEDDAIPADYDTVINEMYRTMRKRLYLMTNGLSHTEERPRVELLHKTHRDTGRVKLICLATGFYPRHINLTMLRDGHPIPEEELILGDLLPNGDGTYQLRRTLSVDAEELRERHHYTCSVTHLTLDNKLDISWDRQAHEYSAARVIHGKTEFPEFSIVLMVNDTQVQYYDSNIKRVVSRRPQNTTAEEDDAIPADYDTVIKDMYRTMRKQLYLMTNVSSHTEGIHVYQKRAGCELHGDRESPAMMWDAYDGTEARSYNMKNYTFNPLWPELEWDLFKKQAVLIDFKYTYLPLCIKTLKKEKHVVLRKERPRVELLHKTHRNTGRVKLICLATGFYPRHINLTMLRDGHPIPEEELILGDLLPNGDGTYQLRRTLSVDAEELRERHHYTCSVTHLTLDNKLDISWEPEDGPNSAIIIVVVVLVALLIFGILAFFIHKKRLRDRQAHEYSAARGSHSLWGFVTFITGETQFPEFSGVIMVDDVPVLYYDGNNKKFISRLQQNSDDSDEDSIHEGVHVYQRLAGCELDNDKESPVMIWDAYDGTEARSYNKQNYTFNPLWPFLMLKEGQLQNSVMQFVNVQQPICIRTLKHYLKKVKNCAEERYKRPRVRLLHKTHTETGEVKLSCLATGFYPRHINLTMLRDGHPIPEEELILGALLPNGDGTYQLRRTLSVGAEELRERHHYTCSVTHLNLDNKLDISWGSQTFLMPVHTREMSRLHAPLPQRNILHDAYDKCSDGRDHNQNQKPHYDHRSDDCDVRTVPWFCYT